jgi:hypothetical protein
MFRRRHGKNQVEMFGSHWVVYLPSSLVRGSRPGLASLETTCSLRSVSSTTGARPEAGEGCEGPGVVDGLDGLDVARSYVGKSSETALRPGVRTAVL